MNANVGAETRTHLGAGSPASRDSELCNTLHSSEVSWWATHLFIIELVAQANTTLPWAGTPAWRALDDADPRKLLSLAVAGEHHVLRVETAQEARTQAAEDVWSGENWTDVAQTVKRRHEIDELRRTA